MELIDRYVYAVTRNLPQKQRADVERELRTLIKNKMNEHADTESDEKSAEKVLLELGDPIILAEKYSNNKKFIIGPQNYHNYLLVLKIVLGSLLLAVSTGYVLSHHEKSDILMVSNAAWLKFYQYGKYLDAA